MSTMDVKDDVAMLQKSDSSHRYDLRLLKTSVGELMSADRSYALEVNQSVSEAKQLLREAFGQQRTYLTRDIAETVKHEVLRIVDEKLKIHLETSSSAAAHAADDIIRRDRDRERNVQTARPTRSTRSTRSTFGTRDAKETMNVSTTRSAVNASRQRPAPNNDTYLNTSATRASESVRHAAPDLTQDGGEDDFDADKVELEMDLLRLEERIREAQRSANATSGARY
jgi:hypothetical protein